MHVVLLKCETQIGRIPLTSLSALGALESGQYCSGSRRVPPNLLKSGSLPPAAATIFGSPSCLGAASRVPTMRCLHVGNSAAFESHAAHHSYRRRDSVPRQRPPVCRRQDSSLGERDGRKGGLRSRTARTILSAGADGDRDSGAVWRGRRQVF